MPTDIVAQCEDHLWAYLGQATAAFHIGDRNKSQLNAGCDELAYRKTHLRPVKSGGIEMIAKPISKILMTCAPALLLVASAPCRAAVGDTISTDKKILSQVVIRTDSNGVYYYIQAEGGWGVSSCSAAVNAYIGQATPGADAILSAVLTAKSTGKPLGFGGICGSAGGDPLYIQIQSAYF